MGAATKTMKLPGSLAKKVILNVKLRMPTGVTLTDNEAAYVIDGWKKEQKAVLAKRGDLIDVSENIDSRMKKLPAEIETTAKELRKAKGIYKKTKDPIAKRRWAKRVVTLGKYHNYLRTSNQTLAATVERVKDAVEDAQIVNKMILNRIEDAQIYRDLNGGLKLVGKALVEARTQHAMPEIEYQSLEFTMEQLDKELTGSPEQLYIEAEAVIKQSELPDPVIETIDENDSPDSK